MQIPGHIAIALLQQRYVLGPKRALSASLALFTASLFPDVIDKTVGYVLKWMPNGRHITHNYLSVGIIAVIVSVFFGRQAGYGWVVGHVGHLLVDIDGKGKLPLFYPFKTYRMRKGRGIVFRRRKIAREMIGLALTVILLVFSKRNEMTNMD